MRGLTAEEAEVLRTYMLYPTVAAPGRCVCYEGPPGPISSALSKRGAVIFVQEECPKCGGGSSAPHILPAGRLALSLYNAGIR